MSFEAVYRSRQGAREITKIADFIGSLVIKNEYEAQRYETSESLSSYIQYHGAYTGTDSFRDYDLEFRRSNKESVMHLMNGYVKDYQFDLGVLNTLTESRAESLEKGLNLKSGLYRDYLKALRVCRATYNQEINPYYRQFIGKPPLGEDPVIIINKDIGEDGYSRVTDLITPPDPKLIYFTKKINEDGDVEWIQLGYLSAWFYEDDEGNVEQIADSFYYLNSMTIDLLNKNKYPQTYNYYILQSHIEELIAKYPDKHYLRFVGESLSPFYLRNLENYAIIHYNDRILNSTELHYFFKSYDKARKQVVLDYINGFDSKQPLYNLLMIQNLLYYTVINYSNSYIERYSLGIYSEENMDDILESHGYKSLIGIEDITIKQRVVKNLNELIANKGNNYILDIILNKIIQDPDSELKRYYLEKRYRTNDYDNEIDINTASGLENSIDLVFREVPVTDLETTSVTADTYKNYDQFVANDNLWGGIEATDSDLVKTNKKDYIKKKLISQNFNSILTKYITLTKYVDILNAQRELRDLVYIMLCYFDEHDSDEFFNKKIDFDKYSVTPGALFGALCWLQQMKFSNDTAPMSATDNRDPVMKRTFIDDADIIQYDKAVITSSVVFRKMGGMAVDLNTLQNNTFIIDGKPVVIYDISPEVGAWKVVDFLKENPDMLNGINLGEDGNRIETARLTDQYDENGRIKEKGIMQYGFKAQDGYKHMSPYQEELEDFLVRFRYFENGVDLGTVTTSTTFTELVNDYKHQYPNLINAITEKMKESYDFREYQAWSYMLQQSQTNNSVDFIFKGCQRFTDYLKMMESEGLIYYIYANIRTNNGKLRLDDVYAVQETINSAFKNWVFNNFSKLVYQVSEDDESSSEATYVNDMKLLFDEFLSVFSQLYNVNYKYTFGDKEKNADQLQLFYNPLNQYITDKYVDHVGIRDSITSHAKDVFDDEVELQYRYSIDEDMQLHDNINNNLIIDDGATTEYIPEDQFEYKLINSKEVNREYDHLGLTGKILRSRERHSLDSTIGLRHTFKIISDEGEKIYYE